MARSPLQKHFSLFVEQKHAKCTMKLYLIAFIDFMAVAFCRKTNVFITIIDQNAIFIVEKEILLIAFGRDRHELVHEISSRFSQLIYAN